MHAANTLTTPNTEITADSTSGAERRRYPRLVFAPTDGVSAGLSLTALDGVAIRADVMNLSRGGLGLGIPRGQMGATILREKDVLVVTDLTIACRQVRMALEVSAQIRWTMDADTGNHFFLGCAFSDPLPDLERKLAVFVASHFPHLALG